MGGGNSAQKNRSRSRTGCLTCRRRKKKCDEESYPVCLNCKRKSLTCEWPQTTHELNKKLKQVRYIQNKPRKSAGSRIPQAHSSIPYKKTQEVENYRQSASKILELKKMQDYSLVSNDVSISYLETHDNSMSHHGLFKVAELDSTNTESVAKTSSVIRRNLDQGIPKIDGLNTEVSRRQHGYFLERIALQQDCVDPDEEMSPENQSNPISNYTFPSVDPITPYYLDEKIPSYESSSRNSLQNSYSPNTADNSINYEDFIN